MYYLGDEITYQASQHNDDVEGEQGGPVKAIVNSLKGVESHRSELQDKPLRLLEDVRIYFGVFTRLERGHNTKGRVDDVVTSRLEIFKIDNTGLSSHDEER